MSKFFNKFWDRIFTDDWKNVVSKEPVSDAKYWDVSDMRYNNWSEPESLVAWHGENGYWANAYENSKNPDESPSWYHKFKGDELKKIDKEAVQTIIHYDKNGKEMSTFFQRGFWGCNYEDFNGDSDLKELKEQFLGCQIKEFTDDYEKYWKTEGSSYAQDFFGFCFSGQDNNDGQAYMYIDLDVDNPKVKLCFTTCTFDKDSSVINANEYLTFDLLYDEHGTWQEYMIKSEYYDAKTIVYTEKNIEYIEEHSEMLNKEELLDILNKVSLQYEIEYETPCF